jgi:prepilin-type N-terminal cleavage/methylation domain-containing protein
MRTRSKGFTLLELLTAVTLTVVLLVGLNTAVGLALEQSGIQEERRELTRQAEFAMAAISRAVLGSDRLLVPMPENPGTAEIESIRSELLVTLNKFIDRDADGFVDVDNDKDGRIDEDPSGDMNNDNAHGVMLADDDNDGLVDENTSGDPMNRFDDDEDGALNEDPLNNVDDDGDQRIDEDVGGDANGDGCPGVCGVDDDGDSNFDEGFATDDDEDGASDEDWLDVVRFHVDNGELKEILPAIDPVDGQDVTEHVLATGVTNFRVERLSTASRRATVVDVQLTLTGASGEAVTLKTRLRLGRGIKL